MTDFVITGTLIEGPDVDLVELSGLELTDSEAEAVWDDISPRRLLVEVLECEEVELEETEHGPGLSDSVYEYHCGDREEFIAGLREAILAILRERSA